MFRSAHKNMVAARKRRDDELRQLQSEVAAAETALYDCEFLKRKRALADARRRLDLAQNRHSRLVSEAEHAAVRELPPIVARVMEELMRERRTLEEFTNEFVYGEEAAKHARELCRRIREALVRIKKEVRYSDDPKADVLKIRDEFLPVDGEPFRPERATEYRPDPETGRLIPVFDDE